MQPPHIHILDRIHSTRHYHSSKCNRQPRTSVHIQDVYDGTLDVDGESHDDGELVHGDVLPELVHGDDDAVLVHGGDAVLEQVHDDDAVLLEQVHDVLLEHDEQDVIHVLLLQVLDDVRHHELVLLHDYHLLCWKVLALLHDYLHHDYYVLAQMYAVELHLHVNAAHKLTLT